MDMLKNIIDPVILAQQILFAGKKNIDKQVTTLSYHLFLTILISNVKTEN